MPTHRSLNKLEFKAHMSIHNFVEVEETPALGASYTRDRFGKNHSLKNDDGTLKVGRFNFKPGSMAMLLLFFFLLGTNAVWAQETYSRSTNILIESEDDGDSYWNKKVNNDADKIGFAGDSSTSVGFNEDGDPNMSMRF